VSLGTVVIGGHRFPIMALRLIGGGIRVYWDITGPLAPFSGDVTVYGEDGVGCWQGNYWEITSPVPDSFTLSCDYKLTVDKVVDPGVVRLTGRG
jgi:hypothetical protein